MFKTISIQRLGIWSVYKLWLIGLGASLIPLGMLFGVLAFFGSDTISWNGRPLHGIAALIGGPFLGAFVALIFTAVLGSAAALGLWLYSKFRSVSLAVKEMT